MNLNSEEKIVFSTDDEDLGSLEWYYGTRFFIIDYQGQDCGGFTVDDAIDNKDRAKEVALEHFQKYW